MVTLRTQWKTPHQPGSGPRAQQPLRYSQLLRLMAGLLLLIPYLSCRQSVATEDECAAELNGIPLCIIEEAETMMISLVGEEFFARYISYKTTYSFASPPDSKCVELPHLCEDYPEKTYYFLYYSLILPYNPSVYMRSISPRYDEDKQLLSPREHIPLPDCVNDPGECEFPIDEEQAIEIAREAGFEEGIKPWRIGINWWADSLTYAWRISNVLDEYGGGHEIGKSMWIDAQSGEVLHHDWYPTF